MFFTQSNFRAATIYRFELPEIATISMQDPGKETNTETTANQKPKTRNFLGPVLVFSSLLLIC